ncbi:cupin domain-containing protein [Paraburkholderia sp. BCC1884]|uniref:cupin domain-containing protein n=1 Tax=Paraburkholderia sp. BCC1884 TaxID=2562668 RepID=UPI001182AFF6|nr:cupin domain-containing protein [Paraburkholderia sp. BCC1884]
MIESIDVRALAKGVSHGYLNQVVANVNDHDVHLSVMHAPYFWHVHPDSDETFVVVEGTLVIETDEGAVELQTGQLLTVPRGIRHRTRPGGERTVSLTVERRDTTTVRSDEPLR